LARLHSPLVIVQTKPANRPPRFPLSSTSGETETSVLAFVLFCPPLLLPAIAGLGQSAHGILVRMVPLSFLSLSPAQIRPFWPREFELESVPSGAVFVMARSTGRRRIRQFYPSCRLLSSLSTSYSRKVICGRAERILAPPMKLFLFFSYRDSLFSARSLLSFLSTPFIFFPSAFFHSSPSHGSVAPTTLLAADFSTLTDVRPFSNLPFTCFIQLPSSVTPTVRCFLIPPLSLFLCDLLFHDFRWAAGSFIEVSRSFFFPLVMGPDTL